MTFSKNNPIVLPVIFRLLSAWMAGILCADALTVVCLWADADVWRAELCLVLTLMVAAAVCGAVARRQLAEQLLSRRLRGVWWRWAAACLMVAGLAFIKARCDMTEAACAPFTAPRGDRSSSRLLPQGCVTHFREWCGEAVDSHSPTPEVRSLVVGCLLGDRSGATPAMLRAFNGAGMGHLLAVSGLHLGLIAALLWVVFLPLRLLHAEWLARCGLLLAMWTYVLLIGAPPSAVRAAVLLSLFQGAVLLHRPIYSSNNLCVAAFVLLLSDTRLLYNLSFQMSFVAAASIFYFAPRLKRFVGIGEGNAMGAIRLKQSMHPGSKQMINTEMMGNVKSENEGKVWYMGIGKAWNNALRRGWYMAVAMVPAMVMNVARRMWQLLLFTCVLQVCMMPLMIHYFHRVTVMGCVQAFVVVPLLGWMLSLTVACLLCQALASWLPTVAGVCNTCSDLCWQGVDGCSRWMLTVANWCRNTDLRLFGDVSWQMDTLSTLGCYAVLLLAIVGLEYKRPQSLTAAAVLVLLLVLRL
jgi:ComEC/Rec2-related protein